MLSAIFGQQFFLECYNPVGEMMDIMVLTNSAANFILYCLMSSQFRQTLRKMVGAKPKPVKTTVTITTKYEVGCVIFYWPLLTIFYLLRNIRYSRGI